jgi:hypothetical protein
MKTNVLSSVTRRFSQLIAAAAIVSLVACGGGSGSGNTVLDKAGIPLATSATSQVSLAAGSTAEYSVSGGGGGSKFVSYTASSSDTKVAQVALQGTKFTINAVAPGTAIINVADSAAANVAITVNVTGDSVAKLTVNAPAAVTLTPGMAAQYKLAGGVAPYSIVTSNPQFVAATTAAGSVAISANAAGTSTVTIFDATNASVKFDVTVNAVGDTTAKLALNAPASVTLEPGMTAQYKVAGGIAPYSVVSSNPRVLVAAAGTGTVSITAANPGSATVVVYDAAGTSSTFSATVTGAGVPVAFYTTAPDAISMAVNSQLNFSVSGGVAPYTVSASDAAVVTASITGTTLNIKAVGSGKATLNIRDSVGTLLISNVTATGASAGSLYTTAPSSIAISLGAAPTYTIQGGVPAYIASTSNANVATVTVANGNELKITGVAAGIADIVLFDSTGSSIKIATTVAGGTGNVPLYSTAPDAITVIVGASPSYTIAGGAGPYVVTSSDVTVATVSQTGSTFTVNGVKAGTAVVSIHDANGTPLAITVTVP